MKLKKNDCLKTPPEIYLELGEIDLDPCAGADTTIGNLNYAIERGQDGLSLDWFGFVYCNPPFSQKELWAKRMAEHGNGIMMLPERGSAPWFGLLAFTSGKIFTMGKKINFEGGSSSNNLGSVLFLLGNEAVQRIRDCELPGHLSNVEFYRPRK